ncbi:MAG: hypothetical protein BWY86_00426 [Candidatus Aminicenantes bacterium ADurb.Bin508]|nr:MAG: hypothetical protein BWY86_00426 [Candidatus Aminicenantes bacterium ADurb.Bin508]
MVDIQDREQDSTRQPVELRTAARFLRTTPEAVRKRIQRGKLEAYKEDGRWLVLVDTADRPDGQSSPVQGHVLDVSRSSSTVDLYERLLQVTEEATRYRVLSEVTESSRQQAEEDYRRQIAELMAEKRQLEEQVHSAEEQLQTERSRGFWSRLFGVK